MDSPYRLFFARSSPLKGYKPSHSNFLCQQFLEVYVKDTERVIQ